MKSRLHYRRPKLDLEEQAREKKRWDNTFHPNLIYWKRGPLDHLKRFLGRIGIIITVRIELPKEIILRLEDKIYAVHRKKIELSTTFDSFYN